MLLPWWQKEEVGSVRSRSCSRPKPLYLQQNSTHVSIAVIRVQLAQQQLGREPLTHKVGDSVAIVAVEDTIEVAVVLTPIRDKSKKVTDGCGTKTYVRSIYKNLLPSPRPL